MDFLLVSSMSVWSAREILELIPYSRKTPIFAHDDGLEVNKLMSLHLYRYR